MRRRMYVVNVRRMRRGKRSYTGIILILGAVFLLCSYFYINTMRPLLCEYVATEATKKVNLIINQTISRHAADNIIYENLIHLEKDAEGRIISLTTDAAALNMLKLNLEELLLKTLTDSEEILVYVPLGSIFGNEFLSGRGPNFTVPVMPLSEVQLTYKNEFNSAGINQTQHRIFIDCCVGVRMMLPLYGERREISSSVCIAETIIVGLVPQFIRG